MVACSEEELALPAVALALLSGSSLVWLVVTLGFVVASVARCDELEALVRCSAVLCSNSGGVGTGLPIITVNQWLPYCLELWVFTIHAFHLCWFVA